MNDSNLEVVDIQGTGLIDAAAFNGCTKLAHLLLRGSTKTTLDATSAFTGTQIAKDNGAIYVPSELLATYRADTNWKNYFITTLDKYPMSDFSTIEDDWPTIIAKAEAGTAADSYSIGDTKLIDLGTEGKVYAQIVAFNVDPLASDGTKTAGITFISKGLLSTMKRMNMANSSGAQGTGANGGWRYCEMRRYLRGTVLPMFPSTIQSAIKEVTKYSDYIVPGESTVTHDLETADNLWIPSSREIVGGNAYEQTGPSYTTFFVGPNERNKKNVGGGYSNWWLRSAYSPANFRYITNGGGYDNNVSTNALGVVLGFCI